MSNDPQTPTNRPTASQSPPVSPKPTQREHFKVGEVVWLKSGGPAMTVREIQQESVSVVWMDPTRKGFQTADAPCLLGAWFPRLCLTDKDPRLEELKNAILSSDLETETLRPYPPNEPRVIRVEVAPLTVQPYKTLGELATEVFDRIIDPIKVAIRSEIEKSAPATMEQTNAGQVNAPSLAPKAVMDVAWQGPAVDAAKHTSSHIFADSKNPDQLNQLEPSEKRFQPGKASEVKRRS